LSFPAIFEVSGNSGKKVRPGSGNLKEWRETPNPEERYFDWGS
jgi:hypothetical protein